MGLALESNGFKDSGQAQMRKLDEFFLGQLNCELTSQSTKKRKAGNFMII